MMVIMIMMIVQQKGQVEAADCCFPCSYPDGISCFSCIFSLCGCSNGKTYKCSSYCYCYSTFSATEDYNDTVSELDEINNVLLKKQLEYARVDAPAN